MKPRNLRDLEIDTSRVGLVGDLWRKSTAYDVWALDPATASGGGSGSGGGSWDQDELELELGGVTSSSSVGAEELNGLSILLPSKRKGGKLYLGALPALPAVFFGCGLKNLFFQFKSPLSGILYSPRALPSPQNQRLSMRRPNGRRTLMKC